MASLRSTVAIWLRVALRPCLAGLCFPSSSFFNLPLAAQIGIVDNIFLLLATSDSGHVLLDASGTLEVVFPTVLALAALLGHLLLFVANCGGKWSKLAGPNDQVLAMLACPILLLSMLA